MSSGSELRSKPPYVWMIVLAFILLALAFFLPRAIGIGSSVTMDEPKWQFGGADFLRALSKADFARTYIDGHPGVIPSWVGAAAFAKDYPQILRQTKKYFEGSLKLNRFMLSKGRDPFSLLITARYGMLLVNTAIFLVAFWLAQNLFGFWPALVGALMIAFEPYLAALTRLLHLDGQMGMFALVSVLGLAAYYGDKRRWIYLLISAIAGGLAFLTKTPAMFLAPFVALVAGLAWLEDWRKRTNGEKYPYLQRAWSFAWPGLVWGGVAALVYFALFPALWVNAGEVLNKVFFFSVDSAGEGHEHPLFFNGQIYPEKIGGLFYPITFLWRATPLTVIGLILAAIGYALKMPPFHQRAARWGAGLLALFAILFMVFMNLGAKQFDRYIIASYAPLSLVAGLGWFASAGWLGRRLRGAASRWAPIALLVVVVLAQLASLLSVAPHYLSYYSPLMGGGRRAPEVMQIGWGEGMAEAAAYLKTRPDYKDLVVRQWIVQSPFSFYWPFEDEKALRLGDAWDAENRAIAQAADYLLVYLHQFQRHLPGDFILRFQQVQPEHIVEINGIPYVYIYKVSDLPVEIFEE
jgi:hypothetical protein